jgi:hypothetical protein
MHMFGKDCLPPVLEVALGVKSPPYGAIGQTEEKITKSHIPSMLDAAKAISGEKPDAKLTFRRAMVVTAHSLSQYF